MRGNSYLRFQNGDVSFELVPVLLRPMLHVVFVAFFLLVIMGATAFFHKIYGWTNMASSIIGAVVGGLLSTGLYAAARTAWGLWCQGGRVEEDPEAHMGYADTQPAWRQHSNPR
eukprot:evm.model.scf_814.4 EVM.evm.TU.scf_814.4   scf_814:17054-17864(+)